MRIQRGDSRKPGAGTKVAASDEAAYMIGSELNIDGAQPARSVAAQSRGD